MDVPHPLGAGRRPDFVGRTHRADARAQCQRAGARQVRRTSPRADGGPGLVRRVQRHNRAADRGRAPGDARLTRRSSRHAAVSIRRASRLWRFRSLGPILRNVDRSNRRRPDRRRRTKRARLGASHAVAEGRRCIRVLDRAGTNPDADPDQTAWKTVLAMDASQRDCAQGRQGRIHRHARRQDLDPEAAEVSRPLARYVARQHAEIADKRDLDLVLSRRVVSRDCAPRYRLPVISGERPCRCQPTKPP